MANYTVSADDWTDLSTLMGNDYNSGKSYNLYVNQIPLGLLQIAIGSSKPTTKGMELPSFSKWAIGTGKGSTFWAKASASDIDIYIYE